MTDTLKISNLHVTVEDKEILKGISAGFAPRGIHGIVGPNGIGKSTLLLQAANALAAREGCKVLYVSGEESPGQVRLRARRLGPRILVDLHVQVDGTTTVSDGHQVAERVRQLVFQRQAGVSEVLVHIDPEPDEDLHELAAQHLDPLSPDRFNRCRKPQRAGPGQQHNRQGDAHRTPGGCHSCGGILDRSSPGGLRCGAVRRPACPAVLTNQVDDGA